jgi:UDP-N-acetylmuramoylalanine--D-glutamate ligase
LDFGICNLLIKPGNVFLRHFDFYKKKVVVVGLGRSGVALATFLAKRGAVVTATDHAPPERLTSSIEALEGCQVQFTLGGHDEKEFASADLVVLSPGVPHTLPILESAREKGVAVIGEMGLAVGMIEEPILAVTGTNGKTTTTELIGEMLKRSGKRVFVGGNIGTPLISYVDGTHEPAEIVVAEVSSFQLDTIVDFRPSTAVMLNLTDDHLDRYENFTSYAASKWRVFENQKKTDTAIVNGMNAAVAELMEKRPPRSRCLRFSDQAITDGALISSDKILLVENGRESADFSLVDARIKGPHNRENIAAACLAARAHGASDQGIQQAIDGYNGLPHRLEPLGNVRGVNFFNDSKATNVDAVLRALECFEEPVVLIMGGQNKKNDFTQLRSSIHDRVKTLVVMGEAKEEIMEALAGEPIEGTVEAGSLKEAVEKAMASARPGETVLFSPACASFDMFDSYVQRGNRFRELVERFQ